MSVYSQFEDQLIQFVKDIESADPAHDFAHISRVVAVAKMVASSEKANLDIVVPAAWLHDCVAVAKDSPLRNQASKLAADKACAFLRKIGYPDTLLDDIRHAIEAHSYSANIVPQTLEAKIVQDADRLDALGAIGVARCMLVGGAIGRALYCSDDPVCEQRQPDDKAFTIDHFFTKLLHIGDTMNTDSATREAKRRTNYMHSFLEQLVRDINAEDFETLSFAMRREAHSP